jgi:hypothetical protein
MLTVRPVLYTEDEAIVHHNSLWMELQEVPDW